MGTLTAVCRVHRMRPEPSNPDGLTAIDKRPVDGAMEVGPLGLDGDRVCDPRHHGGEEQAVYAYADEDAAWWAAEVGWDIPPGLFGENLRTSGIDVCGAEIGEHGASGAYLAVVESGAVAAADPVVEAWRPGRGVTVRDTFPRPEPAVMQRLLDAEGLDGFELIPKMGEHAALQASSPDLFPVVIMHDATWCPSRRVVPCMITGR